MYLKEIWRQFYAKLRGHFHWVQPIENEKKVEIVFSLFDPE
jgi:hypothetical protein